MDSSNRVDGASTPEGQSESGVSKPILKQQSTKNVSIPGRGVSFGVTKTNSFEKQFLDQDAADDSPSRSMNTSQFLKYRQRTTQMFGLPSQFFQSRQEIRTWGAELTDPAVQPYSKETAETYQPFHVTLPGYGEKRTETLIGNKWTSEIRDPLLGPNISISPPHWVPQFTKNPNFDPQRVGYDYKEEKTYKMEYFPYVNAYMTPRDPEEYDMYDQANPYTAYPYGVPLV